MGNPALIPKDAMQNDNAARRERRGTLALNITRLAMGSHLSGFDALIVVEAVRAIRNAIPETSRPASERAS